MPADQNHLTGDIVIWIIDSEINCGKLFGMLSKQIYTLEKGMYYRLKKYESRLTDM